MIWCFRFLSAIVVLELAAAGYFVAERLRLSEPPLPDVEFADPVLARELRQLSRQARTGSSEQWRDLGQALVGHGDYSHAELCFRRACEMNPEDRLASYSIAFCLARTGRVPESTALYREFARSARGELRRNCLYEIGRNYLREKDVARAEETFRRIYQQHPAADYQLARILLRTGRTDEAIAIIDASLERIPTSMNFLRLRSQAMESMGRTDEALKAADRGDFAEPYFRTNTDPNFVKPYSIRYGLGREIDNYSDRLDRGNADVLDVMLQELRSTIGDCRLPQQRDILYESANRAIYKKHPRRALHYLDKARQLGFQDADSSKLLGDAAAVAGDQERAVAAWQRVVKLRDDSQVHQKLADYYRQMENRPRMNDHQSQVAAIKGREIFREGKFSAAAQLFQRSLDLNPDDSRTWFYCAEANRHLQNLDEARRAYSRCLDLNPNHGRAIRQLERLSGH